MMRGVRARQANLTYLAARGFKVAPSLAAQRGEAGLRPVVEIAARLMALDALFTWVVYDEIEAPAAELHAYVRRSKLERGMTPGERRIYGRPRDAVRRAEAGRIGWRLENMWPLAWVLGFRRAPTVDGEMIASKTSRAIVAMLPRLTSSIDELVAAATPRPLSNVLALEDRFYCCHNAVRSAQLGHRTVPRGFDPIAGGGVIHERRHALTWCLSPGVAWDATDLST